MKQGAANASSKVKTLPKTSEEIYAPILTPLGQEGGRVQDGYDDGTLNVGLPKSLKDTGKCVMLLNRAPHVHVIQQLWLTWAAVSSTRRPARQRTFSCAPLCVASGYSNLSRDAVNASECSDSGSLPSMDTCGSSVQSSFETCAGIPYCYSYWTKEERSWLSKSNVDVRTWRNCCLSVQDRNISQHP